MPSENSFFDSCQRFTSKGWRAFLLVNLAGLAACSAVPPSEPPALHVPAAFKEGVPGSSVWQTAQPQDAVPGDWWRLFNDPVGLASARNSSDFLLQVYARDTGEIMRELSRPVRVGARHWGAVRLGFR